MSDAGSYKETEAGDFSDFLDLLIKVAIGWDNDRRRIDSMWSGGIPVKGTAARVYFGPLLYHKSCSLFFLRPVYTRNPPFVFFRKTVP